MRDVTLRAAIGVRDHVTEFKNVIYKRTERYTRRCQPTTEPLLSSRWKLPDQGLPQPHLKKITEIICEKRNGYASVL